MADILNDMANICARHGSELQVASPDAIAGVAANVQPDIWPVNGLRHRPGSTSGWFIWTGRDLSTADDFFKPLHIRHLIERCPAAMPYLGLAPGFRFLIAPDYEDVWLDPELLDHEV